MRGEILDFSIKENIGYISGDDGRRYTFVGKEWKEEVAPQKGDIVDFEADLSGNALKIYKISSYGEALKVEAAVINDDYRKQLEIERKYNLIQWFLKCCRHYIDFSGRARRKEFWYYFLCRLLINFILIICTLSITDENMRNVILNIIPSLISCVFFIPDLSVTVRRLHDTGRSGWWSLLMFVGYVYTILSRNYFSSPSLWLLLIMIVVILIFIILCCIDTNPKENQWGLPAK